MQPKLSSFIRILPFLLPGLRVAAQGDNPEVIWTQVRFAHLHILDMPFNCLTDHPEQ
jgi:hypothetical protein